MLEDLSNFRRIAHLGAGAYSTVYKAEDLRTGEMVAIKTSKPLVEDRGVPSWEIRELAYLTRLQHPNIIKLHHFVLQSQATHFVLECLEQDLAHALYHADFPEALVKPVMRQVLEGVAFMHGSLVIHRDLKLQNILLTADYTPRISDFGLARKLNCPGQAKTPTVQSLWYRSPEVLIGSTDYGAAIDVWSLGCIFGELLIRQPLFPGSSPEDQLVTIFAVLGLEEALREWTNSLPRETHRQRAANVKSKLESVDPLARGLLAELLKVNPDERVIARQALRHPYFHN